MRGSVALGSDSVIEKRSPWRSLERLRLSLDDGVATTAYVARYPLVGHLHGTELMLLEQIEHGAPAHWTHAGAWAQRMRAGPEGARASSCRRRATSIERLPCSASSPRTAASSPTASTLDCSRRE